MARTRDGQLGRVDRAPGRARRRAFTIVEVLIVIGVVILLLSILLVAMNKAVLVSQAANTRSLMTAMSNGIVQFKEDVGYYPPVLDDDRALLQPPLTEVDTSEGAYADDVQDYHSITSAADYLLGYDNERADGFGRIDDATIPALGIRSPGSDGVWGATIYNDQDGTYESRNGGGDGRVLGPYIELKDAKLLGGVNPSGDIVFPGEDPNFDDYPKVIVDFWGTPIRYYRRLYPPGGLRQSYRPVDRDGDGLTDRVPTLSDVYVLRPFDIEVGDDATVPLFLRDKSPIPTAGGQPGDPSTSTALNTAEFALLSAGADKVIDETVRRDDDDYNNDGFSLSNQDNIVEIGP